MQPRSCLILLLFLLLSYTLHAQLCQGSLGDPVVNITFGAGANPGAPLSAATTNYTYLGTDCPNDGQYTVRSQTLSCFGNSWHTLTQDHTGNPNGYFMLVNASIQPNDFYVGTVSGLCPGTTFEFAAWITNVLLPSACGGTGIQPNITFSIETTAGTQLASFNSGNIPSTTAPAWKQYGFYFQTPAGVSDVVIRMTNNAPGGCGNDLALDDITFRPCGPLISPFFINTNNNSVNFCLGDTSSVTIGATLSGGYPSPQYQWQLSTDNGVTFNDIPGATTPTYKRLATGMGTYMYRLTVAQQGNIGITTCRVASAGLTIHVNPNPTATAANNGPTCAGSSITITAGGGTTYAWAGPGGFTAKGASVTVPSPADAAKYYVTVTNSFNCSVVDSTVLTVYANPVAGFTAPLPFCVNNAINFINKSTAAAGQPISGYSWSFGDGGSSTSINTSHIFTTAGSTYTVGLIATTSNGCKDTATQQLTIHYLPQAAFVLPQVCLRDPYAQFTNASTIQDGTESGLNYLWNFGDAYATAANPNYSQLQNPKHNYTATGVYMVKLTVTSTNACVTDTVEQFTVNGAYPKALLDFSNGDSLCSNQPLVITNKSTVNFGSVTRVDVYWDYSNNPSNKITDDSTQFGKQYQTSYPAFDNPDSKTYSIKYVAYSGISCVNELDTVITLKASPMLAFDTIGPVCAGTGPYPFTQAREVNAMAGAGMYSGSGTQPTGLFTPAEAGTGTDSIYYTFTAGNGCKASIGQTVKVYAQPTADAGPDRQLLQGGSLTINASAGGEGLRYAWTPDLYINGSTLLMPTVSPPADITYTLTATSQDGCAAQDSMHITVLKTPLIPNAFSPNGDGVNDTWVINYLSSYASVTVQVFNRYGQAVFFSNGYAANWDGTSNGKPLPVGTYYYIIDRKVAGAAKLTGWVAIVR